MFHEDWKPIVGYEGAYEVSDRGRVRSLRRLVRCVRHGHEGTRTVRERILSPGPDKDGYLLVVLHRVDRGTTHRVHQLVLTAFVGPKPLEHEGCHQDGNPRNNHLSNLYWGTRIDNADDRERHGHTSKGEHRPAHKLTEQDIPIIQNLRSQGFTLQVIADRYHVTKQLIWQVTHGKIWTHVPDGATA